MNWNFHILQFNSNILNVWIKGDWQNKGEASKTFIIVFLVFILFKILGLWELLIFILVKIILELSI